MLRLTLALTVELDAYENENLIYTGETFRSIRVGGGVIRAFETI